MSAGRPRTFFHCHPEGEDPGVLLDPDQQVTEPWGEPEHGSCGEMSDDCDLDADHGALLVLPRELVSVEPLDAEVVRSIRDRTGEEEG